MKHNFQFNKNHCSILFPSEIVKKPVKATIYYGFSNRKDNIMVSLDEEDYAIRLETPLPIPKIDGDDIVPNKTKNLSKIKLDKFTVIMLKALQ